MKIKPTIAAPALVFIIYAALLLSRAINLDTMLNSTDPYLAAVVVQLLIFILPTLFFCTLRGGGYAGKLRLRPFAPRAIPFVIVASVLLILVSCATKLAVFSLFGKTLGVDEGAGIYNNYTIGNGSPVPMLYLALAFAIIPAITEEFTFRGVILAEYESCGVGAAVFFSAFYFAMLHFDIALFPVYFAGGLILALSAYVTRSVIAPIVIHTANNLFALFLEEYIWRSILQPRNIVIFTFITILLLLIFMSFLFGEAGRLYKIYGKAGADSSYVLPPAERTGALEAFVSPLFMMCFVLYIIIVV